MSVSQENGFKISCRGLWKIFGKNAKQLVDLSPEKRSQIVNSKDYTIAVDNVNCDIKTGEIFVVIGLSGSGKSTLLRCMNYLQKPSGGEVIVDGQKLSTLRNKELRALRQKKMGMVFQNFGLLPQRTVIDNVSFGLEIQNISKVERYKKATEMLELVGLKGWHNHFPQELSGGMQQRVGLARALAVDPEVLLMDEAFSALDPLIRKQMQQEFLKIVEQLNKTIIFITHDLDEALTLADRVAVMNNGKFVQVGTPEEIVLFPADNYVKEFVGSISKRRVISAQRIMNKTDRWTASEKETPDTILNKMQENHIDKVFVTNSDNKLIGVIKKDMLLQYDSQKLQQLQISPDTDYTVVKQDTLLEDILGKVNQTGTPIAVLDDHECLLGVISQTRLLNELAN